MNKTTEESTGGQYHVVSQKTQAHLCDNALGFTLFNNQVIAGLLEYPEIRLVFQNLADRGLVQHAVSLRSGCPHGRALSAVEHTELDACLVGSDSHGAAEGIDFLDQMAFADTANGGVAAHLTQRFNVVTQQ